MARFVIDPPALLEIVGQGRSVHPSHQLVAPNSIRSQALDLLLGLVASGDLHDREALEIHERMTELKMRLLGDRVSRRVAWQLSRAHGWDSIRHAEYLAVTQLQGDALVAADPELVGKATGLVELAPLAALANG